MNNPAANIRIQDIEINKMEQETSEPESIVLHKSENAWKPSYSSSHPLNEKEKLRRCVQGTLNKLTFQKFKILFSKIQNLNFNKVEDLELLTDLIFENAFNEPYFCILYANLCKELCEIQLSVVSSTGTQVHIQEHLLTKCLTEFENYCIIREQETLASSEENIDIRMIMVREAKRRKIKNRQIGIVRLLGELFNFHIVRNATLHECIGKLLTINSYKSLELVCEFFKTAGKELDASKLDVDKNLSGEYLIDVYFAQMQSISDNLFVDIRIRFILHEIFELRKNNWIPRRIGIVPKTIDEIHEEIELENKK